LLVTTHLMDCSGRRRLQRDQRDRWDPTDREATEVAHRPPRGKRPPVFCIATLASKHERALKRKSTMLMNQSFGPKHLKHWIY